MGEIQKIIELVVSEEKAEERFKIQNSQHEALNTFDEKVDFYNGNTSHALSLYNRLGVVSQIDANGHIDNVYEKVVSALWPTLIFIYCPPGCWATSVARNLSNSLGYTFLSFESLGTKSISPEQHLNILIDYLEKSSSYRFIVDSFFASKRLFTVFLKEFCAPYKVIYFNYTKDQAYERILSGFNTMSDFVLEGKKAAFKAWLDSRDELLAYLNSQSYFFNQFAFGCNSTTLSFNIRNKLAPQSFLFNPCFNELADKIVGTLEKEKGFVCIDTNTISEDEITRGTTEGKCLSNEVEGTLRQILRKILFRNPNHKNFLISGITNCVEECIQFEDNVTPVKYFLDVISPDFEYPENSGDVSNEITIFNRAASYYWSQGKLLKVSSDSLEFLEIHLEKRNVYGMVIGFPSSGKTSISKHICSKINGQWVDYEELTTKLKEQLGTPDEPLDELAFPDQIPHIAKMIAANDPSKPFIFDGFPFELQELKNFIEKVGTPSFVVDLNVIGEVNVAKAFKRKNEMEPDAELSEEDLEKLEALKKTAEEFSEFIKEISSSRPGINYFAVNANFSMSFLLHQTDKIFQKRVFAVESTIDEYHSLYPIIFNKMASHCLAKGIAFVDVSRLILANVGGRSKLSQNLLSDYKMTGSLVSMLDYPGVYSSFHVLDVIKNYISNSVSPCRDILLFGYPCASALPSRSEGEKLYPRAIDMLSFTEDVLGPIRSYFIISKSEISVETEEPMIEWPAKEEPIIPVKKEGDGEDGEEKEEEPPAEEEEGEEGVVKFDPTQFSWTNNNGIPKDFVKVYFQHKRPILESTQLEESNIDELNENLSNFISRLEEGSQDNLLKQWIL